VKILKDVDPAADLRRGDPEAVPVLIELLKDNSSLVRQEAILILARIGAPAREAMPALGQALNDPDEQVRARAVTALRQIELATSGQTAGP
jgi:HEAT repeat protein